MLSNKTFDVSRPTDSSELFPENENKNQNCSAGKQKSIHNLIYHGEASVQHFSVEEEDKTNKDEESFQFKYKDWKML